MALNTLVVLKIAYLFHIRNLHGTALSLAGLTATRAVWITLCVAVAAQGVLTYWPFLQIGFGTRPLGAVDLGVILGMGVVFLIAIELEKQVRLSLRNPG